MMSLKDFVKLELGYIAWLMRRVFGLKFTIRFIAVFPASFFFRV